MLRAVRSTAVLLAALLAAVTVGTAPGCSSRDEGDGAADGGTLRPGPAEWNRTVTPPEDSTAEAQRSACAFKAGALPAETQGASHPMGDAIPVDHIVVVMMENRSFDHYFQLLPQNGQPDADVAPTGYTNPGPDGAPLAPARDTQYCIVDPDHGWNGVHEQYADGKMTGFVSSNEGRHELPAHGAPELRAGKRALTYYGPEELPFMYWAAREFTLSDRYFSAILGPTWPNRMYLYAASSFGQTGNAFPESVPATLFENLETRGVSWKVYASGSPGFGVFLETFLRFRKTNVFDGEDFFRDVEAGTLPEVTFLDPFLGDEGFDRNDEHPPAVMQVGQAFLARVVKTLGASPYWPHVALFITYDEHGGFYDHVPPPTACPPDDRAPLLQPGDAPGGFDRYGVRVPFVVVSPFAKRGHVSHRVMSHTSITRFIEARFTLPALSARDANAEAPWDAFDFTTPPHPEPPQVPEVPVDAAKLDACRAIFVP